MKYLGEFVLLTAHINNNHGRVRCPRRLMPNIGPPSRRCRRAWLATSDNPRAAEPVSGRRRG
jgi:hypothetical protein